MKQPLIHQYNEATNAYDVREMTEEERADSSIGFGREFALTGSALNVLLRSTPTQAMILQYNNAGVVQSTYGISVNFIYEVA